VSARFAAAASVAALLIAAFSLACALTSDQALSGGRGSSLVERLSAASRRALADDLCVEADRYFHRGVPHRRERAFTDAIGRLAEIVRPTRHEHIGGGDICEMMPWLRFATLADPENIEAYTGAAFWVAREKKDALPQALGILREARRRNPYDYRVPLQEGSILLHSGDLAGAERAFDLALRLWPRAERCSEEQTRLAREALLNYRGFLHELRGDTGEALRCYREYLALKPDAPGMRDIVARIERGARGREEAERILRSVFLAAPLGGEHVECSRVRHHGHDHEHH